ncbi:MAG: hypothetical protein RR101_15085, partial [Burkholderiaceae bacterium]
ASSGSGLCSFYGSGGSPAVLGEKTQRLRLHHSDHTATISPIVLDTIIGVIVFVVLLVGVGFALRAVLRGLARSWRAAPQAERPWLIVVLLLALLSG